MARWKACYSLMVWRNGLKQAGEASKFLHSKRDNTIPMTGQSVLNSNNYNESGSGDFC